MYLRRELPNDVEAIEAVHSAAFSSAGEGATTEARLVNRLRDDGALVPGLSIVTEHDGKIIAHVACSYGSIGDRKLVALAPIGVLPDYQGTGVGSALMHAVIAAADALGEPCIVLLGDPAFYAHYGFRPASESGVMPPDPSWASHFQLRRLTAWDDALQGTFRYASAFDSL